MVNTSYEEKKLKIAEQAKALVREGYPLSLGKKTSNLFRSRNQQPYPKLDVTDFNTVLTIDSENLSVEVEGMTTYETLVNETLKFGFLPTVVPQLKTITIGGALTGIGIESSSFKFGLVHETVLAFDLLLADGRVVTCQPDNEYKDLFFAIPNSYGTLGYVLKIKLKLIRAKKFVKLTHLHFYNEVLYFEELTKQCNLNRFQGKVDYIDGVVFDKNHLHLTLGEFCDTAPYQSNYSYMNIYYKSISQRDEDYLTTLDYIWRWDTDWFWCSKFFGLQNPILRAIFGKFMLKSSVYWKWMDLSRRNRLFKFIKAQFFSPSESVIQDVAFPIDQCVTFLDFFQREIGIKPIWICPFQKYRSDMKFDFCNLSDHLYVDFGFWDSVPAREQKGYHNIKIEKKIDELQGWKSLYSDVYYNEDHFWNIYNKILYDSLKNKYDPQHSLKDLYQKVTER